MKIISIENIIKYELSERIYARLTRLHRANFEKSENELRLTGRTLKEKGLVVHELIVLYAAEIAETFKEDDLTSRVDFKLSIIPRLINSQIHLEGLTIDPDDQTSYWELIDILGEIVAFKNRALAVPANAKSM